MDLDLESIDSAKLAEIADRFDDFIALFQSSNVVSDSNLEVEDDVEKQNLQKEVKWAILEETIDQIEAHSSKKSQPLATNDLPTELPTQHDSKIVNESLNSIKLEKSNDIDKNIEIMDKAIEALELMIKRKSEDLPQDMESAHETILENLQLDYEKHKALLTEVIERVFVLNSKEVESLLKKLYNQFVKDDEVYTEYKNTEIANQLIKMRLVAAHPDDPTKLKLKHWL